MLKIDHISYSSTYFILILGEDLKTILAELM